MPHHRILIIILIVWAFFVMSLHQTVKRHHTSSHIYLTVVTFHHHDHHKHCIQSYPQIYHCIYSFQIHQSTVPKATERPFNAFLYFYLIYLFKEALLIQGGFIMARGIVPNDPI